MAEDLLENPTEIADTLKPAVIPLIRDRVVADLHSVSLCTGVRTSVQSTSDIDKNHIR